MTSLEELQTYGEKYVKGQFKKNGDSGLTCDKIQETDFNGESQNGTKGNMKGRSEEK